MHGVWWCDVPNWVVPVILLPVPHCAMPRVMLLPLHCCVMPGVWCHGVLVAWWMMTGVPYPGVCSVVLLPAPWWSDAPNRIMPVVLLSVTTGVWYPHALVCIVSSRCVVVSRSQLNSACGPTACALLCDACFVVS